MMNALQLNKDHNTTWKREVWLVPTPFLPGCYPEDGIRDLRMSRGLGDVYKRQTYNELLIHFPELRHWVTACYGVEAVLNFGNSKIISSVGFHQGDPLATLLFSINLHKIVHRIEQEIPNLEQNSWILDDGVLVGEKEDLKKVIEIIKEDRPRRGLYLSNAATPGTKLKTSI